MEKINKITINANFLLTPISLRHRILPNNITKNADEDEYASKRFQRAELVVV